MLTGEFGTMFFEYLWFFVKVFFLYRLGKSLSLFWRVAHYLLYPKIGWSVNVDRHKNMWAVITGCTDGIGKAYTEELAERGFTKFLLISRSQSKLDDFANFLEKKYGAQSEVLAFDFTNDDYTPVKSFLSRFREIGLLVNNVGGAVSKLEKFTDQPPDMAEKILKLNSLSVIKMVDFVLPKIIKQNLGIIVTVSSIQGWRPIPLQSTYSPSKVCASFFSECLQREYQSKTIRIQCLFPGLVATKMTKYKKAEPLHVVSAKTFAKQAVDVMGVNTMCCGSVVHEFQAAVMTFFPWWMLKHMIVPYYAMQRKRLARTHG